jgi:hypothetical protein
MAELLLLLLRIRKMLQKSGKQLSCQTKFR